MDNITHGVIWWSIFSAITWKYENKNFGRWFLIGNLPDIDVILWPLLYNMPMDKFFFHRWITHSIIFILWISIALTIFSKRYYKDTSWFRLFIAYFLTLILWHLMVDWFTSYGIRPFLPWSNNVYSTDNIYIVDLPMLCSLIFLAIYRLRKPYKKIITKVIIVFCTVYFLISFIIKIWVDNIFKKSAFDANIYNIEYENSAFSSISILTMPEPLQLFLRRSVVPSKDGYYEWYYSLLDKNNQIDRKFYPKCINEAMWPNCEQLWSYISFWQDGISISDKYLYMYRKFSRWYNTYTYIWWDKFKVDNLVFARINWWIDKFERNFSLSISTNIDGSGYIYDLNKPNWDQNNSITAKDISKISQKDINMFLWRIMWIKK